MSIEPPPREVILGFIVGYLAMMILLELWKLYTEWALEMERQKVRIFFEEKAHVETSIKRPADVSTLEGGTTPA